MKKFVVETYYTCTFKTVHNLDDLNENELSKIDNRTGGQVEVIDVKLNNRKTRKVGDHKSNKEKNIKVDEPITQDLVKKNVKNKINNFDNKSNLKLKIIPVLKCQIEKRIHSKSTDWGS